MFLETISCIWLPETTTSQTLSCVLILLLNVRELSGGRMIDWTHSTIYNPASLSKLVSKSDSVSLVMERGKNHPKSPVFGMKEGRKMSDI